MKRHRMTRSVRCLRMKRRYDTDPTVEHAPYVTHTLWPNHQQATAEYIYILKRSLSIQIQRRRWVAESTTLKKVDPTKAQKVHFKMIKNPMAMNYQKYPAVSLKIQSFGSQRGYESNLTRTHIVVYKKSALLEALSYRLRGKLSLSFYFLIFLQFELRPWIN